MSFLQKAARKVFNMPQEVVESTVGKIGVKAGQKSVITVGIRGSGKTSVLGCLELCCDIKSQRQPNFSHFMRERTSGIRQVPCDLAMGKFPMATPPGIVYEADEIMRWTYPFGTRSVVMSFCETAGEDMQNLAGKFTSSVYEQNTDWQDVETLNKYICNAHGYLMMLPVSLLPIPGMPKVDEVPEGLHANPDLSCARILSAIYGFKADYGLPPIEGIGIIWTKYDMIQEYCKANNMDLYTPEGSRRLMETYFRQTLAVLKYYGLEKVAFFPFHIQAKRRLNQDGSSTLTKQIAVDVKRNIPIFAEQSGYNIIDWIGANFAR
jgi:hypothetical protein